MKEIFLGKLSGETELQGKNPLLADFAIPMSGGNLNELTGADTGNKVYMGQNMAYAPSAGWWFVHSYRHNTIYGTQVAYSFTEAKPYMQVRNQRNGTWEGWHRYAMASEITSSIQSASLRSRDERSTNPLPYDTNSFQHSGMYLDFKDLNAVGVKSGGAYCSVLTIKGWYDSSGDRPYQLAFTPSGYIYYRWGYQSGWDRWLRLAMEEDLEKLVTTDTSQNISGSKSFMNEVNLTLGGIINDPDSGVARGLKIHSNGLAVNGESKFNNQILVKPTNAAYASIVVHNPIDFYRMTDTTVGWSVGTGAGIGNNNFNFYCYGAAKIMASLQTNGDFYTAGSLLLGTTTSSSNRYITAFGKTGASYICFGYREATRDFGTLGFNYASTGNSQNYTQLSIAGDENYIRVYPDKTVINKPLEAPNAMKLLYKGTGTYILNQRNTYLIGLDSFGVMRIGDVYREGGTVSYEGALLEWKVNGISIGNSSESITVTHADTGYGVITVWQTN